VERRLKKAENWDRIATSILGHAGGATVEAAADVRNATAETGALYGAEFWGVSESCPAGTKVDQAQASIGKEILSVRSTAEAAGVLTELGWASSSKNALKARLRFWWRLGKTKSALLQTLEYQAKEFAGMERAQGGESNISEYNWFRRTAVEVGRLVEFTKLDSGALRKLPRKDFAQIADRYTFTLEYRTRLAQMQNSSRLHDLACEIETRKLRGNDIVRWPELRAGYLPHLSSKHHVRLLAMTRLGLLPIESEVGRWNGTTKQERWCTSCAPSTGPAIGDSAHFCRECTGLSAAPVPHWSDAPNYNITDQKPGSGAWWRSAARKLELRWREKLSMKESSKVQSFEFHAAVREEFESGDFILDEDTAKTILPKFLEPGSAPPEGLVCEVFTDGSKRGENESAGWGVWGVILDKNSSTPEHTIEAWGQCAEEQKQSNMTGELTAIAKALSEIRTLPTGSVCLIRFDCIPAMMLATGIFKSKASMPLVTEVSALWREVAAEYSLVHMHVKGHTKIYGNVQADKNAEKGAAENTDGFLYRTVAEFGGGVRFAELYHTGDCGLDADLERKYAGKKKACKKKKFATETNSHRRAIQNHLRHLGCRGERATKILEKVLNDSADYENGIRAEML